MTYIFTAPQLAGVIQQALKTDDPLVLENVAFLAELFYQDETHIPSPKQVSLLHLTKKSITGN